jgi:hypothetical protein
MDIKLRIAQIADKIRATETKQAKLANFLRETNSQTGLFFPVKPAKVRGRIVAVDGGLLKQSFHGFDCLLLRAVAVCFEYREGKVVNVAYIPSKNPIPKPELLEALSDLDWAWCSALYRIETELKIGLKAAEVWQPDMLLMDGPLVPHYADRPGKKSQAWPIYQNILKLYKQLYQISEKILLAGVVEDSRSNAFANIISNLLKDINHPAVPELRAILAKSRDTILLYSLLKKNERTKAFKYSQDPETHPVLKDLIPWSDRLQSFYLKTVSNDRPIRIDFLLPTDPDILAALILPLCSHPNYGLPAPLIEADNVAALPEIEMEKLYAIIQAELGPSPAAMRLRREGRPFKK